MTTLLVEPLNSELTQEMEYTLNERCHLGAIIPYLYLHNASADYFRVSLKKSGSTLFSKDFTVTEVKTSLSTSNNYAHVFYPIIPTNPVQIYSGTYTVHLEAGPNYNPTESSFIGWVRQFEDVQNEVNYTVTSDDSNPLALRLKIYKEGVS